MKIRYLLYAAIFIGIVYGLMPGKYIILKTDSEVKTVLSVEEESTFTLHWRHSVEKEVWEEIFKVEENDIFIKETRFKTFGAGVPSNVGSDTYIKDGWVYMVGIDRKIGKELRVRTGKTTEHHLKIYGKTIELDEPEQAYTIEVKEMAIFQSWTEKLLFVER